MRKFAAVLLLALVATYAAAGTITRGTKSGTGSTDFGSGTTILATEVNDDFNSIYNEFNGNITNENIDASAEIAFSKIETPDPEDIDDHSTSDAEQIEDLTPGDNSSPSKATSLRDELKQIRYVLARIAGMQGTVRRDATGTNEAVGWIEQSARGENLVLNGNFAVQVADGFGAGIDQPAGFTEEGTVSSTGVAAPGTNGTGYLQTVQGSGSGDGIAWTLENPKKSTKYLVAIEGLVVAGTPRITTAGADAATSWRDLEEDMSGAAFAWYTGVVQTDSTPTDLVVKVLGSGGGYTAQFRHIGVYEISDFPLPRVGIYDIETDSDSTHSCPGSGVEQTTDLSVDVVVPSYGYAVKLTVDGEYDAAGSGTMLLELDSGAANLTPNLSFTPGAAETGHGFSMTRIATDLAAGTYTIALHCTSSASAFTLNELSMVAELIPLH